MLALPFVPRRGRSLDCELKQFRLAGDVLMEAGAALELSTALAPQLFLPLACTANLAKNLAAVAASSTRAPIYRTFARANNLADVTAKGESVANLADVVGTAAGIVLARAGLPVVPTFTALSVGYLLASRREVDSVVLPYLNRARLSYAARRFLATGRCPGTDEGNAREPLLPWADPAGARLVLGARVGDACGGPAALAEALHAFRGRQYALTYRPDTRKVYVLLKRGAAPADAVRAALDAHAVLYMVDAARQRRHEASPGGGAATLAGLTAGASEGAAAGGARAVARLQRAVAGMAAQGGAEAHVAAMRYVAAQGGDLFRQFDAQATAEGWRLPLTMLNPSETRLEVVA